MESYIVHTYSILYLCFEIEGQLLSNSQSKIWAIADDIKTFLFHQFERQQTVKTVYKVYIICLLKLVSSVSGIREGKVQKKSK